VNDLVHGASFTSHLANPIADVAGELALSLYAVPPPLRTAIALRAMQEGLWIHVDIMRDSLGRDRGVDLATLREITDSGQYRVDVHLIGDVATAAFDEVCALGCTRVTVASECCTDIAGMSAAAHGSGVQLWIAIAPPTDVEDLLPMVSVVDGVLVMLLKPGTHEPADLSLLSKARILASLLPVGVDGSVGVSNVNACLEAGARYIVSGRGLIQPNMSLLKVLTPLQSKGKR